LTSQFLNGFLLVAQDAAVKMGAWQMVLWQPRWVYAEVDGFCYQKISTAEKPIGKPKKILYADIKEIEELDCAEVRSLTRHCNR